MSAGRRKTATLATATFAAAVLVSGLAMSAHAGESLPASASIVRNTIVAMSLADAALPVATAISASRDVPVAVPLSTAAMKPETSNAMAAMRTPSVRRQPAAYDVSYFDRRYRPYRDPFVLMIGVAY